MRQQTTPLLGVPAAATMALSMSAVCRTKIALASRVSGAAAASMVRQNPSCAIVPGYNRAVTREVRGAICAPGLTTRLIIFKVQPSRHFQRLTSRHGKAVGSAAPGHIRCFRALSWRAVTRHLPSVAFLPRPCAEYAWCGLRLVITSMAVDFRALIVLLGQVRHGSISPRTRPVEKSATLLLNVARIAGQRATHPSPVTFGRGVGIAGLPE